jgi:hypothetical protein
MLLLPNSQLTEERPMRTSIRSFTQSVETLLTASALDLPRRTRQRLVFFILGILLAGSLVLRRMACTHAYLTPQTTCAASHERRLRRVIGDPHLTWERSYARVVRRLLARQRPRQWLIILDESGHTDRLRVLTAALWYRGRAIPLAWVSWPGQTKQTTSYWTRCASVLEMVATVLPDGATVVVVRDRAFGCPVFTDPVAERGWDWLVRVQGQTRFRSQQGQIQPLRDQVSAAGQRWKGRGWLFKDAGWREASAVVLWGRAHREPLLLASSLPLGWDLIALYKKRAAIEALFRDWKTSGWQWEASQVRELAHQERLLLGLAFATMNRIGVQSDDEDSHQRQGDMPPPPCGRSLPDPPGEQLRTSRPSVRLVPIASGCGRTRAGRPQTDRAPPWQRSDRRARTRSTARYSRSLARPSAE